MRLTVHIYIRSKLRFGYNLADFPKSVFQSRSSEGFAATGMIRHSLVATLRSIVSSSSPLSKSETIAWRVVVRTWQFLV
jgi:hypothetical protein